MRRFVEELAAGSLHDEANLESKALAGSNHSDCGNLSAPATLFDVRFLN